jgi:hypothetical protein
MTTWPWPITFSFGKVKVRPWIVNEKVEARKTMPLVMVFDRRIMGGGPAGRIFEKFKEILEKPDLYLAETKKHSAKSSSSKIDSLKENVSRNETL